MVPSPGVLAPAGVVGLRARYGFLCIKEDSAITDQAVPPLKNKRRIQRGDHWLT
ncbi:hypothetical protein IMZ38_00235 [Thermosphaera chiliense]|uniref:Uncharacterized protein n=1 Tax=Thermosphaera chiliense TaxID=3402707 RepID=A0A7M1UTE0_9CREN|nr:hypothetical protein [Thermosphaera aggregans]QOR94432.1 hypothetical protein IMZ38_00235 [Thermosphaera aggregans]